MEFTKRKFEEETLRSLAYGKKDDRFDVMMKVIVDQGRWTTHYDMVIFDKSDDTYWRIPYSQGSTEMQQEVPFEYDELVGEQVEPVIKHVVSYEPVS